MIVREAVLHALTEDRMAITQSDLLDAIDEFGNRVTLMVKEYTPT